MAVYPLNGESGGRDVGPNKFPAAKHDYVFPATGPNNRINGSFGLEGDFIEIPNNGNLDTRRSTSILLWVYHEGQSGPVLHYGDNDGGATVEMWLSKGGEFTVEFADRNKDKASSKMLTTSSIPSKMWTFVAIVYDYQTGVASLWLNGRSDVQENIGQRELATDSSVVRMGTLSGEDSIFLGRVSTVQFYNVALSGAQISVLMRKFWILIVEESSTETTVTGKWKYIEEGLLLCSLACFILACDYSSVYLFSTCSCVQICNLCKDSISIVLLIWLL